MAVTALLLVGSPKPTNSTSAILGDYLLTCLNNYGYESTAINIHQAVRSANAQEALLKAVEECDILILSCPLYVDSAPAAVIQAMETIAANRKLPVKKQLLLAISNCGFPEAIHNHPALAVYKCFAQQAGFEWAGGLALGGGGVIDGKPLTRIGGMVRNVVKALDLTAAALATGQQVPAPAIALIEKPLMPNWLYLLGGHLGWYVHAFKYGTWYKLNDQPYRR